MRIALFTNISRSYSLYRKNRDRLAQEAPKIQAEGWLFASDTEWTAEWAERFAAADVVLILWMGTGLDNPFLRRAAQYMEKRGSRYLILVENAGTDKVSEGFPQSRADGSGSIFAMTAEKISISAYCGWGKNLARRLTSRRSRNSCRGTGYGIRRGRKRNVARIRKVIWQRITGMTARRWGSCSTAPSG